MEIELLDIIILLLPIMLINIYLSTKTSFNSRIVNVKFPFILISYSILITTPIFILLVIFHVHVGNSIVFHIHDFQSIILARAISLDIDFIALLITIWSLSIIYSAFLISQFGMRLLHKFLENDVIFVIDPLENLTKDIKVLILRKNISVRVISMIDFGAFFSISYLGLLKRKNSIFVNEKILQQYTKDEFNAALAHEIGHIYNLDTIVYPIISTLAKLMFFDPILKKLRTKYRDKMEENADLFAIRNKINRKLLTTALLKTVQFINSTYEFQYREQTFLTPQFKCLDQKILTSRIKKILKS